jgi:hypothetical protein
MKLDNDDNPVSRLATKIIFGSFVGFVVLGVIYYGHNHPERSSTFRVAAVVLSVLAVCSVITYFRPRGFPAFITSSAYVGVIVVFGVFEAGELLQKFSLPRWLEIVIAAAMLLLWFAKGIHQTRQAHQAAGDQGERR